MTEGLNLCWHLTHEKVSVATVQKILALGADVNESTEDGDETAIHFAARGNHCGIIKLLVEKHADLNLVSKKGMTPLCEAVSAGHVAATNALLLAGANINGECCSASCMPPLYCAAENGHSETVRALLFHGAEVNKSTAHDGWTALHAAARKNFLGVVDALLEAGTNIQLSQVSKTGRTPLNLAAIGGHTLVIERLVAAGASVNDGAWPALYSAASNGHHTVVKLLVALGADVNGATTHGRWTALHCAAEKNFPAIVDILLEAGAHLAQTSSKGHTALGMAAAAGHANLIDKLAAAGADVNEGAWPALCRAALNGHVDAVRALLALGADVHTFTAEGKWTALHYAAEKNHQIIVQFLLEAGARLSQTDGRGNTALGWAARAGHTDMIHLLANAGADVNEGAWPALGGAALNGQVEAVRALLERGAYVNGFTTDGRFTALHYAAERNHFVLVKILLEAGADMSQMNSNGLSAVGLAAAAGHADMINILVAAGADFSADSRPALGQAALNGHMKAVETLIALGADVDGFTSNGKWTALHYAAEKNYLAIVDVLVAAGAQLSQTNGHGITAMGSAARAGHVGMIHNLAAKGASVDDGLRPAIGQAAMNDHFEAVRALLTLGADAGKCSPSGWTALHQAADKNRVAITELLLEHSAPLDVVTDEGMTPLRLAVNKGNGDIVSLLLKKGCTLDGRCSRNKWTALEAAAINGHEHIVRMLLEKGSKMDMTLHCSGWIINQANTAFAKYIGRHANTNKQFFHSFEGVTPSLSTYLQEFYCQTQRFPVHAALRHFRQCESLRERELLNMIAEHDRTICDVDDFGNTALMVACNFDAPVAVVEDLMRRVLMKKLESGLSTLLTICIPQNWDHKYPTIRLVNEFRECPVYLEITVHSKVVFQVGISCVRNYPRRIDEGVGDYPGSIALDGHHRSILLRGKRIDMHSSMKVWEPGTVVGVYVDPRAGVVEFSVDGESIGGSFSISNCGEDGIDAGYVFAVSTKLWLKSQSFTFNFGECPSVPFLYPRSCKSVSEYVTDSTGSLFSPLIQVRNVPQDRWDSLMPTETSIISCFHFDWNSVISCQNENLLLAAARVIQRCGQHADKIANDIGMLQLKTIEVAPPIIKKAITSLLYFDGRYEFLQLKPKYESKTCAVFVAIDSGTNLTVALKFMIHRENYDQECKSRQGLDELYVIPILVKYDGDANAKFIAELERRGLSKFRYCIVMPAGRRNLYQIVGAENICSGEKAKQLELRRLFEELVLCTQHLHAKGFVHCDIKPLNIMRNADDRLILIDLDASCKIGESLGLKFSCAYAPPEAFCVVDGQCLPRTIGSGFDLVKASPEYDVWSLGVVLFQLCSGKTLFHADVSDDVTQSERHLLYCWDDHIKQQKLTMIKNDVARNLVSRMLSRDPRSRPSLSAVLQHPFVSNKSFVRLVGQEPEHDVFISYRVATEKELCSKMFDALERKGLRVWMDRERLVDGKMWEEGFCNGLIKSKVFVCLISEDAVANTAKRQCFCTLHSDSPCDNVLLEHQLSLELEKMTLLEAIFPIFIGKVDNKENPVTCQGFNMSCLNNMPDVCVTSVATKVASHLEQHLLGTPLFPTRTVKETMNELKAHQGCFFQGDIAEQIEIAVNRIMRVCKLEEGRNLVPTQLDDPTTKGFNGIIRDYEARIQEKDAALQEKDAALREKDARIRELELLLRRQSSS